MGSPRKNFLTPESLKLEIPFSGRAKGFLRERCQSGEGKTLCVFSPLLGVWVTAGFGQSQRTFCLPLNYWEQFQASPVQGELGAASSEPEDDKVLWDDG